MIPSRWVPASVSALKDYSPALFLHDLVAGVTVGLVALPLAMAFAIASGLTPQAGIYCAIVTGFLISALGDHVIRSAVPPGRSWSSWPGSWPSSASAGSTWSR